MASFPQVSPPTPTQSLYMRIFQAGINYVAESIHVWEIGVKPSYKVL
jgi:hypothetical protein